MLFAVFAALYIPATFIFCVFLVYVIVYCVSCFGAIGSDGSDSQLPQVKPMAKMGLSSDELNKLPKIDGKELVMGTECAVCLDVIENGEQARMVPGCKHGFHVQCADTWLSKHRVCPICRKQLDTEFFTALENPC